ncbi:iron-containing alcohol dehydrogenase, partial [Brevundimonas sp.]|uniref:iron-containing alcohol dehydrogenase n=1 Tax=Brevundimonas sp. TaxID=1871086 RepID=UPI002EDAB7F9
MTTTVPVSGGGFRPYEVVVGHGLLAELGARVAPLAQGRTVVITDETVGRLHGKAALASLKAVGVHGRLLTVPAGEASKSFSELERVIDRMLAFQLDRKDVVVALGGGVVGDL